MAIDSEPRIKSVLFQDSDSRYGNKEVRAIMDDGGEQLVFAWFDDELRFLPGEFIGLTVEEARDLKTKRDIAYLQS